MFQAALEGVVRQCDVTWTGAGTWRPVSICYDWDKATTRVSICTFPPGTALSYGEVAQGTCSPADSLTCY